MNRRIMSGITRDLVRIARELIASDEGTQVSIDHIDWDLEEYANKGERLIDTLKRLGLPVENFVVEVFCDEDDMEEIDMQAEEAARDYIADNYGEEYADCIVSVGWSIF